VADAHDRLKAHETLIVLPVALAAVYGGYFGAGLSVILLAVLGLVLDDSLTRLNVLKQILSFGINMAAAIFFLFSGQVVWPVALVMAVGALIRWGLGRTPCRLDPADRVALDRCHGRCCDCRALYGLIPSCVQKSIK
jgi:uncharacterized membrane protein YfcA